MVTTASLRAVADQLGCRPDEVAAARFRADVVLDGEQPFAEDAWRECELDLGSARVRVTGLVPRCAVVDHDPVTGERDRPVLRALVALAQQRGADGRDGPPFGLEAVVVRPGDVRVGDAAALRPARAAQPR
nr:MOSC domain-containing protein [Nocardioides perillae]